MKSILALDLGTRMGYAIRRADGSFQSGSEDFSAKSPGEKFYNFNTWIHLMGLVDSIYFEDVKRHTATGAAHAYGGFKAILQAWTFRKNIELVPVGVGTIKKSATTKGNAKKNQMVAAMTVLGFSPADDNEADALALLQYALNRPLT